MSRRSCRARLTRLTGLTILCTSLDTSWPTKTFAVGIRTTRSGRKASYVSSCRTMDWEIDQRRGRLRSATSSRWSRLAGGSFLPVAQADLQPTEASKAGGALHNQDLTPLVRDA